jgi:hypothetical protein
VNLPVWRGQSGLSKPSNYQEYDTDHWFIKTEILPDGEEKLILKHKSTGEIIEKNSRKD